MNQQEQDPLSQILRNALSGNDSLRKEAESQITRLASENLSEFLIKISSKISNENFNKITIYLFSQKYLFIFILKINFFRLFKNKIII